MLAFSLRRIYTSQALLTPRSLYSKTCTPTRRFIQTANNQAEAFLEQARSGIAFLSLNRPKAKNAISLRLLKVHKLYNMQYSETEQLSLDAGIPRLFGTSSFRQEVRNSRQPSSDTFTFLHDALKLVYAFSLCGLPHKGRSAPVQTLPNGGR
jgi:hypothetical protein